MRRQQAGRAGTTTAPAAASVGGSFPFALERLGVVMTPLAAEPTEALGVLNPATARKGTDLYLFPRIVATGNYSRVGRARVLFDGAGIPIDVERLGIALEPQEAWELHAGGGGVEDPRITYLPGLGRWIMTYVAYGPFGPRIGLAASDDLDRWERLGPVSFAYDPALATDLNLYPNKDAVLFPEPVTDPSGNLAYAMLHRPMWDLAMARPGEGEALPAGLADPRPGIWVSFVAAAAVEADLRALARFGQHRLVALPEQRWEAMKVGGGTPPIRIAEGWLVLHHGVAGTQSRNLAALPDVRYCAGALILDAADVTRVVARSVEPLLEPDLPAEQNGVVPNVVFPTAIEPSRGSTGSDYDVYYGMADSRIGVARLRRTVPISTEPAHR
jgi:beta-1,2-mannobiose phosphorylase / 1,2-beta-oligomannan phosphorylase